jgi:hypothetical protein
MKTITREIIETLERTRIFLEEMYHTTHSNECLINANSIKTNIEKLKLLEEYNNDLSILVSQQNKEIEIPENIPGYVFWLEQTGQHDGEIKMEIKRKFIPANLIQKFKVTFPDVSELTEAKINEFLSECGE